MRKESSKESLPNTCVLYNISTCMCKSVCVESNTVEKTPDYYSPNYTIWQCVPRTSIPLGTPIKGHPCGNTPLPLKEDNLSIMDKMIYPIILEVPLVCLACLAHHIMSDRSWNRHTSTQSTMQTIITVTIGYLNLPLVKSWCIVE